jgi:hypothetical protein
MFSISVLALMPIACPLIRNIGAIHKAMRARCKVVCVPYIIIVGGICYRHALLFELVTHERSTL